MNTYYDLIVNPDWSKRLAEDRKIGENGLREWFQKYNAEQEHSLVLSNQMWVGDWYTQVMRCRTEYMAFEGRLMFGEVFAKLVVTEQEEGPYIFK